MAGEGTLPPAWGQDREGVNEQVWGKVQARLVGEGLYSRAHKGMLAAMDFFVGPIEGILSVFFDIALEDLYPEIYLLTLGRGYFFFLYLAALCTGVLMQLQANF